MADGNGQADIRGLDVDKLAKGFADEDNVFKKFVVNSTTKSREMRWYQKTSGFLDVATTSGITASKIIDVAEKARPFVTEQTWTRQTSYIKKYFVESPTISMEDIKDTDIDILATNVRDLTRAVARKVDERIYNIITENQTPVNINTAAAVGTGWDDTTNGNPVTDILTGKQNIRSHGYDPEGCVLAMNSIEHKNLLVYLITTAGSSIPNFSSERIKDGVVMSLLGCNVLVSENAPTDSVGMWVTSRAATWKAFTGITAVTMDDPGIGKKIRVWEEGECLLTDPKAVHLITDTVS